jgi:AP2-associated kinase
MEKSLPPSPDEDQTIESNVEFLRSMEGSAPDKKDKASKHLKRGSLSSLGAGTKSILAGKFGDAFKRFEGNSSGPPPARTPSPLKDLERHELTPIAGSEAIDGRSDDGQAEDWESMTPEMRREQEARMLAQEEARVAAAQAEYRQRVEQRGGPPVPPKSIGGVSRVASIQNKVQSLIDESNRSSTGVSRTAQGYGHYSDAAHTTIAGTKPGGTDGKPAVPRKPLGAGAQQFTGGQQQQQQRPPTSGNPSSSIEPSATGRTAVSTSTVGGRPMAPPKPMHLNNKTPQPITSNSSNISAAGGGPVRAPSPTKQVPLINNSRGGLISSPKLRRGGGGPGSSSVLSSGGATEALLAVDLPGGGGSALLDMTAAEKDDYIRDFQKRFPSLGAIEMVERDLAAEEAAGGVGGVRTGR